MAHISGFSGRSGEKYHGSPQEQEKQDNLRAPNLHSRPSVGIGVRIVEEPVGINSLKVEETKELPWTCSNKHVCIKEQLKHKGITGI